ncbi:hypothetical protein DICSQDRAFT_167564 [Dichomitus squalens LYAD-421 SS1]|uniref:uncharacterized protein n=1 Tax=Dichomitus squalens (strain LYAD-421) TaxID=732165 RepID=UPI0004415878|nr:uncharacterized protein DICSQDRAFT_167564 [Dichomitus squalens LYAD-421 SS1]EJF64408.1 hypothetical protein DICSQDRAFT_167564 [Dichomitus squalens LYAD-421 SS1]
MVESPTSSQTAAPAPRLASSPFDKPDADIVLRSADGVDFCVRSHILIEASPVFESILSIPQPQMDGRPIIGLTEDHKTLDIILRICYPIVKPDSPRSLGEIELAVKAALKYDTELPLSVLKGELFSLSPTNPTAVWAIDCRTGLEDVARRGAAEIVVRQAPLNVAVGALEGVSAGDYYRLREFHRKGGKVEDSFRLISSSTETPSEASGTSGYVAAPPEAPYPDLVCTSSDGIEVPAHRGFLASASPVLKRQIDDLSEPTSESDLPVLRLSEPAQLLKSLLGLCYPGQLPDYRPYPAQLAAILAALTRYEMQSLRIAILPQWEDLARAEPLRAYLIASRAQLRDCATTAAEHTLHTPLEGGYVAEMESSPARAYHHLLTYHASCRAIAKEVLQSLLTTSLKVSSGNPPTRKVPRLEGWDVEYVDSKSPVSQDAWLTTYVEQLVAKADINPKDIPLVPSAFDAATTARQWCTRCATLAQKLSVQDAAVELVF